ncbi:MAG: hypothetical protein KTR16_12925 [Acidiferrobacterales bacterium]|nr:hypothetical protein [Acidiferrobacterales bacterium]
MNDVIESAANNPEEGKNAKLIYILYLVSIVVGVTSLIGVVMAYLNKGEAPDWVKSHYQFLIRTFWIGLLYGIIGLVLMTVLIGFLVLLFVLVWYIVRCVKGMQLIEKGQPHPDPTSWMFG